MKKVIRVLTTTNKGGQVMKKVVVMFIVAVSLLTLIGTAFADVYVRGYSRGDGTYVQPHYRSNPDGNAFNNWSSRGNINPYTGREGTIDPYRNQYRDHNQSPFGNSYPSGDRGTFGNPYPNRPW